MRFVTTGSSRLRADSSSSRAHCGVPARSTIPPPRPIARNAGCPASRPAAVIRRALRGRSAGDLEQRELAHEARQALEQPEAVLEHRERGLARVQQLGLLAERIRPPRRRWIARAVAAEIDRALERVGAEHGHAAAVGRVVAQALHQLARRPELAARERHARGVPERGTLAPGQSEVGGEVVREPLAIEPAQQRRDLGGEALAAGRPPRTGGRAGRTRANGSRSPKPSASSSTRLRPCQVSAGSTTSGRARLRALRGGRPATASGQTARSSPERTRTM